MINWRGGNWLIYLSKVGFFIAVFCITDIIRFNVWWVTCFAGWLEQDLES